jgi:hypothetical protein
MSSNKLSLGQVNYTNDKGVDMTLELNSNYMALALGKDAGETPSFIKQVNGEVDDPHPLTVAIKLLFGDRLPPDILDYFGKVSPKKKSLHKNPLTFSEVLEVIQKSTQFSNEKANWKIDNSIWKTLKGNPEGSAFTVEEIGEIAYRTKEHYAIVAVPSGFYYYSTLVNLHDIISFLELETKLPEGVWEYWWTSAAISIWVIYEGLGLGGLNRPALQLHAYISEFSRRGTIELEEDHPDANLLAQIGSYDLIYQKWTACLLAEGIQLNSDCIDYQGKSPNEIVLDTVLWLAHLRGYTQKLSKGNELSNYQNEYSFGELDIDYNLTLASIASLMRDSAKGRMNLNTEENEEENAGCLKYLLDYQKPVIDKVVSSAKSTPGFTPLGVIMLKDFIYYQTQLTKLRLIEKQDDKY